MTAVARGDDEDDDGGDGDGEGNEEDECEYRRAEVRTRLRLSRLARLSDSRKAHGKRRVKQGCSCLALTKARHGDFIGNAESSTIQVFYK